MAGHGGEDGPLKTYLGSNAHKRVSIHSLLALLQPAAVHIRDSNFPPSGKQTYVVGVYYHRLLFLFMLQATIGVYHARTSSIPNMARNYASLKGASGLTKQSRIAQHKPSAPAPKPAVQMTYIHMGLGAGAYRGQGRVQSRASRSLCPSYVITPPLLVHAAAPCSPCS